MAWMDEAAFVAATRYARCKVVTVHTDAIDFHHPVPQGSVVELVAWVTSVGCSSMRLEVEMWVELIDKEERILACRAGFIMVARESALESLAENLNDSLVAPLFWFVLLGLPGAALYRFANTADALWGYRGRWEWAGKFAAKADDLLNYIPARITGLLLCGFGCSWKTLSREAHKTPSPNSGWPMTAMPLLLDVRLSKPGVYVLHPKGRIPTAPDVWAGLRRAAWAGWGAGLLAASIGGRVILGQF